LSVNKRILFVDESLVEDYIFKLWEFTFNNTFYMINDLAWDNFFHWDFCTYPDHLGVEFHVQTQRHIQVSFYVNQY